MCIFLGVILLMQKKAIKHRGVGLISLMVESSYGLIFNEIDMQLEFGVILGSRESLFLKNHRIAMIFMSYKVKSVISLLKVHGIFLQFLNTYRLRLKMPSTQFFTLEMGSFIAVLRHHSLHE